MYVGAPLETLLDITHETELAREDSHRRLHLGVGYLCVCSIPKSYKRKDKHTETP
jgi:hypothetical protein